MFARRLLKKQNFRRVFSTNLPPLSGGDKILMTGVGGGIVGGLFGMAVGISEGSNTALEDDSMLEVIFDSFLFGLSGTVCGAALGFVWPVSVPVMTISYLLKK